VNPVVFDAGPGRTHPAPATLGGYEMTAYPDDPLKRDVVTSVIPAPGGDRLTISNEMTHDTGDWVVGGWAGTTGEDIYADWDGDHKNVTLTLPSGVNAFSLYAMTTLCGYYQAITVTTDNGTSSGPKPVGQSCGASSQQPQYFGFYTTDGSAITTVTLTDEEGYAGIVFGELMQHRVPPAPVEHDRSLTLGLGHSRSHGVRRLDLSGDLSVVGDVNACVADQRVVIKRYDASTSRWARLGSTITDGKGHYDYRTADKKRRYRAVVPLHAVPEYDVTNTCSAVDVIKRHRH
jgi:hypothetical protein